MHRDEAQTGPGELASAAVIVAVFAIVLAGMVVLVQREQAVEAWARASAAASAQAVAESERPAARASDTPSPTPGTDAPGEYTVRRGDSLFSVAAELGLSPNELIYWNRDEYPTLQSTPALRPGWVLRTTGPPLPVRTPEPRTPPTPTPILAAPEVPGLPAITAASFPASGRVTVSWYAVTGATPGEILDSIDTNGRYSEWAGGSSTAHVEVRPSFDVGFDSDGASCSVVVLREPAVSIAYHVVLPAWTPPDGGAAPGTLEWWAGQLTETLAHEARHITLYEGHISSLREIVTGGGTCDSVAEDLAAEWEAALRANCEYDLAEYGTALGLTLESCLELGGS